MFDQIEANSIVTLLYQTVLGREPDYSGLAHYVDRLVSDGSVAEIIREFSESTEYAQKSRLFKPNLMQFRSFPDAEVFVSPEIVDQLFEKTSFYWRNAASEPKEMYWSVVTEEKWNRELTDNDRVEFMGTGSRYAKRVLRLYEKYSGNSTANLSCIDFGAGVGRLAINFASRVSQVHAVDFSVSHLQELQRNAAMFDCASKITVWPIQQPVDIEGLPQVDLVYSYIVLQHNTPPVIAAMMRTLLGHLRPGGYAFLHVPLAGPEYEGFRLDDYLASLEAGTRMEVHILPRANINALAESAGCEIVASHCVGGTFSQYSEEIVFHKPTIA